MPPGAVLYFLFASGFLQKGLAVLIETEQTVMAAVGGEARLSCQLTQSKDVRQVSWQKVLPEGEKDLASSSKHFGVKVKPNFTDKVEFKDAGLQNNSIMIRNVTEKDEGCYHCLFNAYPDGALTGRTCLHVYELHKPVLHVRQSDSDEEAVASCLVTGRPAPSITLNVAQHLNFSNYSTVSVNNPNGTVTVTTTAVLTGSRKNGTQVGCVGRVLSGPQIEVLVMIPESADGLKEDSGSDHRGFSRSFIIVPLMAAFCCLSAIIIRNKTVNRDLEMDEMSQMTAAQRTNAPSVTQENNELRQRTPPKKEQQNINIRPSP